MPDIAPAPAVVHLLQTQPVPVHPSRYRDHTLPIPDASRMLWQSFESSPHRIPYLPEILPSDNQSVHFQYQILYYISFYPISYPFCIFSCIRHLHHLYQSLYTSCIRHLHHLYRPLYTSCIRHLHHLYRPLYTSCIRHPRHLYRPLYNVAAATSSSMISSNFSAAGAIGIFVFLTTQNCLFGIILLNLSSKSRPDST